MSDPMNEGDMNPNSADPPSGTGDSSASLSAEVAALKARAAELEDRNLRLQAELENVRRRGQRELSESAKYAVLPLARDILPVLDNVNRGIQAASNQTGDAASFVEGMKLVAQQMERVLSQHSVTKISSQGAAFDPNLHQAMLQQPHAEVPAMMVIQEFAPGYQLHDRVVRPAQVVVSSGPPTG